MFACGFGNIYMYVYSSFKTFTNLTYTMPPMYFVSIYKGRNILNNTELLKHENLLFDVNYYVDNMSSLA